ncbi:stage III sporulation protein AD [Biomaibacter acetigenes]|jgi:stage III sporulation protein AD|uniref:Stage III sporulation protein AD n=1 Tax=Biomaibacter acetigenes TaxID=2316383 RepID=A0A3G2R7B5_9FIRM|nr:stage III sporulation protein AD [Biomaibacter acetigenes]AYO30707.1 stage III sporulation protein AD [Biomaibacter acetigenes]
MEIVQIVGMGLVATILVVLLKEDKPEIALQISIVIGAIIFLLMIGKIISVVDVLKSLSQKASIDMIYMSAVLKIIGIAYIAEFGAQICRDAGSSSTASKIEFAAKIMILVLSIPILMAVLDLLIKILP